MYDRVEFEIIFLAEKLKASETLDHHTLYLHYVLIHAYCIIRMHSRMRVPKRIQIQPLISILSIFYARHAPVFPPVL